MVDRPLPDPPAGDEPEERRLPGVKPADPIRRARAALRGSVRGPIWASVAVALVFFGGLGAWSVLAPLASAAIAPGTVSPEGHRKTVQHLEGGIIRRIAVADGDDVAAGQTLMVLDETQPLAAFRLHETRHLALRALEARLAAEESGGAGVDWSTVPGGAGRDDAIADQRAIFEARLETQDSWRDILERRIAQLEEEIQGLEAQIKSATRQLELIDQEIVSVKQLLEKGLARLPRLLALQRTKAEIDGRRASNRAAIARSRQAIGETQLQIMGLEVSRRDEAARQLGDVRAEISVVAERMAGARDILTRTVVTAPVAGTVFELKHTTPGGVIRPGEPILDIVPGGEAMLVDARVNPADIDVVAVGLEAEVALTAFPQRNLPRLTGLVRHVSADRLTDPNSGEVYYLARIEVDPAALGALGPEVELLPGMPADVMIFTGTMSLVDYLTGPLTASLHKSLRER